MFFKKVLTWSALLTIFAFCNGAITACSRPSELLSEKSCEEKVVLSSSICIPSDFSYTEQFETLPSGGGTTLGFSAGEDGVFLVHAEELDIFEPWDFDSYLRKEDVIDRFHREAVKVAVATNLSRKYEDDIEIRLTDTGNVSVNGEVYSAESEVEMHTEILGKVAVGTVRTVYNSGSKQVYIVGAIVDMEASERVPVLMDTFTLMPE